MNKITEWTRSEPVRLYLYALTAAVVAALVILGYVEKDLEPVILALVSAALSVPAVETARSKVSPVDKT